MNSNKNFNDSNEKDLNFVPLNIEEPFKSKLDRWIPSINISGENSMGNNMYLGLPPIYIDNELNNLNVNNNLSSPLSTPCIIPNLPSICDNNSQFRQGTVNNIEDLNHNTFLNSDTLYCYNSISNSFWERTPNSELLATDLLRMFDFSLDLDDEDSLTRKASDKLIDKIFNDIETNNPSILGALKAYRIPYPIAALLIKRVIKSTLFYIERE